MASYQTFTRANPTPIGLAPLNRALQSVHATIGVARLEDTTVVLKKATPWTPAEITAAQTVLETATNPTPQLAAQLSIDTWPIETKALALAIIDQLNVIRAALPTPLPAITVPQAIAAIRAKAGTL